MKQIVRAPSRTSRASSSAASPSAERRAPSCSSVSGGFHTAIVRDGAGEPSSSIRRTSSSPVSRSASSSGLAIVAEVIRKTRFGAVGGGDPAKPAQHAGDVRAEHAAVDVGLVDHDDGEVGEQVGPGAVVGQDADVQHVGIGQHDVGLLADLGARLAGRVAVVDGRAHALGQAEGSSARAPGPGRAPWSGTGTAPARGPVRQRMCSVGRLKHIDLPEAVPVVTIVGPSVAAISASAWWE